MGRTTSSINISYGPHEKRLMYIVSMDKSGAAGSAEGRGEGERRENISYYIIKSS